MYIPINYYPAKWQGSETRIIVVFVVSYTTTTLPNGRVQKQIVAPELLYSANYYPAKWQGSETHEINLSISVRLTTTTLPNGRVQKLDPSFSNSKLLQLLPCQMAELEKTKCSP